VELAEGLDAFLARWQLAHPNRYLLYVAARVRVSLASLVAVLMAGTLLPVLTAAPARAQEYMVGIDVSHWQEENGNVINWQKVADSGHVFAFHKATEGTTYSDPRYAGNRTDAASVGLPFGAYHFARPSGGTISAAQADAAAEAQHFIEVAQPASGDLLPVLDLEAHGNLPVRRLKAWAQSWLDTVASAVGVKPIIYTGPNFWETRMNNTSQFADQDFPLWIAHYTSGAPRVPASNWSGRGWTFWQFTSQGKVPGIQGNVDRNYFSGSDLTPYKIPGAPLPEPSPGPAVPPVNQVPPSITGEAEVGATLTATAGTWGGSTPQSYSYEWLRCDANGLGCAGVFHGTATTYEVKPADYGHRIKVNVIATNSGGSSGAESAPTEPVTDTVAPAAPSMTAPKRARTVALEMKAGWASSEAGVVAYDVRYRATSADGGLGDHTSVVSDTAATETMVDVEDGRTYCFSSRAIDEAGNRSEWSGERCSAVPLDDLSMRSSGFTRRTGSVFFAGTMSKGVRRGSLLTATEVRVQDLFLVASRCRGCGKVAVSFNGRRLARIDLAARITRHRRVIRIAGFSSVRTGTIEIRVLSRRLPVKIDGLLLGV
jgi:lysozyme